MAQPDLKSLTEHLEQVSQQVALIPNLPDVKCNQGILNTLNDIRGDLSSIREAQTKLDEKVDQLDHGLNSLRDNMNGGCHCSSESRKRVRTADSIMSVQDSNHTLQEVE